MRPPFRLLRWSVVAICVACAPKPRERAACDPIAAEFALPGQIVYRECAVDRKARLTMIPRVQYTPSAGQRCVRAVVEVVVDSAGRPVPGTARVVRATDAIFAAATVTSLETVRYEPATKDGHPVAQLVRVDQAISVVGVVVAAGTPPGSVRAPRRSPSC